MKLFKADTFDALVPLFVVLLCLGLMTPNWRSVQTQSVGIEKSDLPPAEEGHELWSWVVLNMDGTVSREGKQLRFRYPRDAFGQVIYPPGEADRVSPQANDWSLEQQLQQPRDSHIPPERE